MVGDCVVGLDAVVGNCVVVLNVVVSDCFVKLDAMAVFGGCVVVLGNVVRDSVVVLDNVVCVFNVVLNVVCDCVEVLLDAVDDTDEDDIVPLVILGDWLVGVLKVIAVLTSFGKDVTVGVDAAEPVVDCVVFIVASFAVCRVNEYSFLAVVFGSASVVSSFDFAVNTEYLLDWYVVISILLIVFDSVDVLIVLKWFSL